MLTSAWHKHRSHAEQQRLWDAAMGGLRFPHVVAGRGSGKTEIFRRFVVRQLPVIKPWTDTRYGCCAPTRDQAKRIYWEKLKALVPKHWLAGESSESELVIRTKWGASLHVIGMDKPQRIEGDQWDGLGLDESCDLRPRTFELNVAPALTHRNGFCWRIGVPKRTGPAAAEFRRAFENASKSKDSGAFSWSAEDILSKEQLHFALEALTAKDYAEQIGGVFQDAGGGIYYAFSVDHNVRPCAYNPDLPIIMACDFNVDPMAWVFGHVYWGDNPRIEWFDELWLRDANTPMALKVAYDRYSSHETGIHVYGDPASHARKTSAEQSDYNHIEAHQGLRVMGLSMFMPANIIPVADRYAAVNAMLCNAAEQRRMFIDPRCEHLVEDLSVSAYRPGTREPMKGGDLLHITDAMGYAVHELFPVSIELDLEPQAINIG